MPESFPIHIRDTNEEFKQERHNINKIPYDPILFVNPVVKKKKRSKTLEEISSRYSPKNAIKIADWGYPHSYDLS